MIVYFTATGNSRYCAQMLAEKLDDVCLDAFQFIRGGIAAEVASEKPWVFVSPVYSWKISRIFADFIRRSSFSGSRDAYFILTCGSDMGNAAPKNREICREKGLRCRGTFPVVMPENYIAMFDVPDTAQALKIIEAAGPAVERCAAWIRAGEDFPVPKAGVLDHLKSGIVNWAFYRFQVKTKPFTVSDTCIGCGKCAAVCPLGNISMREGKPVWDKCCTHCMACICACPVEAIEYGKVSRGKPRYQCPKYSGAK